MYRFDDMFTTLYRRADAVAYIKGSEKYKNIFGKVLFYSTTSGVLVRAEITGLPKGNDVCNNPIFAFHIHNGTECSGNSEDAFANANGHYNPNNCPHPYHSGDLPPLFTVKGKAFLCFLTDRFTVSEIIGKAIIIHNKPDDFTTQPSGNAGEKMACGIITKV